MLYQVLTRASATAAWEPYFAMTRDPLHAMTLVQKASESFAEVSIIQAATEPLLREQVRQIRAGQPTSGEASPLPSLTATPRLSVIPVSIENQRWAIERGPGGDHDIPYRFDGAITTDTLRRWATLMAAAQCEYGERSDDAEDMTLSAVVDGADDSMACEVEPSVARPKRVG